MSNDETVSAVPDYFEDSVALMSEAALMKARRTLQVLREGGDEFGIISEVEEMIAEVRAVLERANPEVRGAMFAGAVLRELFQGPEGIEAATRLSVAVALLEEQGLTREE
jgi:hypothetical protein